MKTFHCDNCGQTFTETDAKEVWDSDGRYTVSYSACPNCGNDALAELTNCRICGALIRDTEDYCDKCKWEVRKVWEHAVEKVMEKNDKDYSENESLLIEFMQDSLGVI